MTTNWLKPYGLITPAGELLAGPDIQPVRNHTRMVAIPPDALKDHLYMLYIESNNETEILTVARCLRTVLGLDLRLKHDRNGRPYLWRVQPATPGKTAVRKPALAARPEPEPAEDYASFIYEVPEGYDSWDAFWDVNDRG